MGIISTDKWLIEWNTDPIKICEQLKKYFPYGEAHRIHSFLAKNGMFREPLKKENTFLEKLPQTFSLINKEFNLLRKKWNGPNIPIFIFPSDPTNRKIMLEYNGKSGIAFQDKLFLFLSTENSIREIQALFTHEYNHVCRLTHCKKKEEEFTLLDTVILEGLAENAVRERLGEKYLAPWTYYYSDKELDIFWKKIIYPNKDISIRERKHEQLLYGLHFTPQMAGYAVGFYIVKSFIQKKNLSISKIIHLDSSEIADDFIKEMN